MQIGKIQIARPIGKTISQSYAPQPYSVASMMVVETKVKGMQKS